MLGDDNDEVALTAARDLHARITVADIDWDELLVPEEDTEEEYEEEYEENYGEEEEIEGQDEADEDDGEVALSADDDGEVALSADDDGVAALSEDQKKEVEELIADIGILKISSETKEDLKEYKQDLADGELELMDLNYLRALRARLSK